MAGAPVRRTRPGRLGLHEWPRENQPYPRCYVAFLVSKSEWARSLREFPFHQLRDHDGEKMSADFMPARAAAEEDVDAALDLLARIAPDTLGSMAPLILETSLRKRQKKEPRLEPELEPQRMQQQQLRASSAPTSPVSSWSLILLMIRRE